MKIRPPNNFVNNVLLHIILIQYFFSKNVNLTLFATFTFNVNISVLNQRVVLNN